MYLADYHVHSHISPDGFASMAEMAAAELEAGVEEICFTDHLEPVNWRTGESRTAFDWAALEAEYAGGMARMGERIKIRLGLELGDAPSDYEATERMLEGRPELDFVIGSIHTLSPAYGGMDLNWVREDSEETAQAEVEDYIGRIQEMARWGKFNVMGHLTLPLRYINGKRGFHATFDGYEEQIAEVLRTLIQSGRGIEVNTNRGGPPLPDEKWLRLYRDLGGEIVTIGSDAHRPEDAGRGIQEGQALLSACGFQRYCTFERQKPVWHTL